MILEDGRGRIAHLVERKGLIGGDPASEIDQL
jgi:hypothetical protein